MQAGIPRIFVSIASFCDPMLMFTVRDALEKARNPGRLSLGIIDQSPQSVEHALVRGAGRLAYMHIDPHQSRGACWARALAMTLYAGEDFFFQIDSHTVFDPAWDETLVAALETVGTRCGNPKTILSTRPFAFEIGPDGAIATNRFTDCTLKLVPRETAIRSTAPVISFACHNSGSRSDLPGFQISAAYLFTRGSFVEEVPYDPFFYFHGEEQDISIRAFTHGWDIWHPNVVPLYHLYKSRADGEAPLHWDSRFEAQRTEKWTELRSRAHARLADLIEGRIAGAYGLGSKRSINEYLRLGGMTFERQTLNSTESGGASPPDPNQRENSASADHP
jgi:hypothetical protein